MPQPVETIKHNVNHEAYRVQRIIGLQISRERRGKLPRCVIFRPRLRTAWPRAERHASSSCIHSRGARCLPWWASGPARWIREVRPHEDTAFVAAVNFTDVPRQAQPDIFSDAVCFRPPL